MIDYRELEKKWQKVWEEKNAYEPSPDKRESLVVTPAFPYVNMPLHIGHLRTYGTADLYARYMRMKGINVLYPMGFHATGTPVLAIAKRITSGDKDLVNELSTIYHVSQEDIAKMTDPNYVAEYFIGQIDIGMHMAGFGIDWKRKFLSIEPLFSKLVEWQFLKLKELGYLKQGSHPVGWCTNDNSAVGQHDTKHDVQPEIESMFVIKFKDQAEDISFACATLRPETIDGVTNIFVGEKVQYVVAKVNGERLYISAETVDALKYQAKIEVERLVSASELLAKSAINPSNKEVVPVLPGFFVKGDIGTGVVMSVPSHAPFDYAALERLKASGYPLPKMEYRKLVEIDKEPKSGVGIGRSLSDVTAGEAKAEHPDVPALAYMEILHTNPNAIDDMLEFATKLVYREESHWGRMIVGKYKGMREPEARELMKKDMLKDKSSFEMYSISNEEPVYCRCGNRVIVKLVENQWFINYGDEKWKETVRAHLKTMKIRPEKLRIAFEKTIDWIGMRAAEREQGLGTRFPFNQDHIIESLSDSTIYMCFYTFVNILRANGITPESLKPEFFEYVISQKGNMKGVAKSTGIGEKVIEECRNAMDYWYTGTSNHSGADLVNSHLTMYIFNHVALMPEKFWPKQIVVNGLVNYEGEKMSKSLGNIIPIADGIAEYGSDPLRFIEVATAELDTEAEFSGEAVNGTKQRNEYLREAITSMEEMEGTGGLMHVDYWLYSVLNSKIRDATKEMDGLNFKAAYNMIYYESMAQIKRYLDMGGSNPMVMREFLEKVVLMIGPAMPHFAEELWSNLGKDTLVVKERWPETSEDMINEESERIAKIISDMADDITAAIRLTSKMNQNEGKKPAKIKVIVAEDWKTKVYNTLAKEKDMKKSIATAKEMKIDPEKASKFLTPFMKKMNELRPVPEISASTVILAMKEASEYLSGRFNAQFTVEPEAESKSDRAARAAPEKPSIDIEWG
jgi:leucyl-tRNA synthetase